MIARLLLVGSVVMLVACGSSSPASSSGQVWDGEGVRFTTPPGWSLRAGGELPSGIPSDIRESVADYVVFVTNQQFIGCGPADGFCAFITQLERGGVVAAWSAHHCVAHGCDLPAGDQILVGGRVAVRYSGPGFCRDLLATNEEVVVVTVTPQRVDRIVTCSREPDDAAIAGLAAMFDSIQWRTP